MENPLIDVKQNNLVTFVGVPFSGKTTCALKFVEDGYTLVSFDQIATKHNINNQEDIFLESLNVIEQRLNNNEKVVFDYMNLLRSERNLLRSIAKKHKTSVHFIHLNSPFILVLYRWLRNKITKDHHNVPFKNLIDAYIKISRN